jgi:hypothetical protein
MFQNLISLEPLLSRILSSTGNIDVNLEMWAEGWRNMSVHPNVTRDILLHNFFLILLWLCLWSSDTIFCLNSLFMGTNCKLCLFPLTRWILFNSLLRKFVHKQAYTDDTAFYGHSAAQFIVAILNIVCLSADTWCHEMEP